MTDANAHGAHFDNLPPDGEDCRNELRNGTEFDKLPLVGAACRFEHPREATERELRRIVGLQHAVVHRRQLRAAGWGKPRVRRCVASGLLVPLWSDVFRDTAVAADPLTRAMAAALHLKGHGLVTGRFAMWVWGAFDQEPAEVDLLCVRHHPGPTPGVSVRRVREIHADDARRRHWLPITSPARSWLEFTRTATAAEAASALAMIRREGMASETQLREAWERMPVRVGGRVLARDLLQRGPDELALTRSIYERRLRALITAARLPEPLGNHRIGSYEGDLVYLDEKVIVEFDGWEFHKDRFRHDRRRDAWLAAHGWLVLRFTADRIDNEPIAVAAEIAATLALRQRHSA